MIAPAKKINQKKAVQIYKDLLLPRLIEERMLTLLRQNKISKWFSGMGQEAISVGATHSLKDDDYILPMHRNLGVFTTRGVPLYTLFTQLFGKRDGFTGGRDRSFHFGTTDYRIFGMISHLGSTMPVADGIALAAKLRNQDRVALSFCGDGATSEGDFHEALNLAAVWRLPVIFMIENNGYGLSTPSSEQFACENIADRAVGYGMESMIIDGNNFFEVLEAVSKARKLALSGKPVLIEAKTFRMRGHEEASGTFYVPDELFEEWSEKDPIKRYEEWLISEGIVSEKEIKAIRNEIKSSFSSDLDRALEADEPVFNEKNELKRAGFNPQPQAKSNGQKHKSSEKRIIDAVHMAQKQAFSEDEAFVMMGQDIAEYGGVFKASEGFVDLFGKERIRNTPIIESGAIGAAIGLAVDGFKPVVEMQFADFVSCGYNQIVNNLSKGSYRWMPNMNVTIRAPHGGGVGAGPFHSQCNENWFMQLPGLRVLVPSNVEDTQNMLYTALYDENPVLFFEHKKLYRSIKEITPDHCTFTDLEKASVIRDGKDATIVTFGYGVVWAKEMAVEYEKQGVSIEIVDLRSLAPIDWDTVISSIKKTGRVLLLQENSEILGPMSELSAGITERGFELLDAPVIRCSSLHTPVPFSKELEKGYLANHRLKEQLEKLLNY